MSISLSSIKIYILKFRSIFWQKQNFVLLLFFSALLTLAGFLVLSLDNIQDYAEYCKHWKLILSGVDPWVLPDGKNVGNTYGPLYALFAPLYGIHPKLPRMVFVFSYFVVFYFLAQMVIGRYKQKGMESIFFMLVLLSPLFYFDVIIFTHFDIIVAAFVFFAFICFKKNRMILAGVFIAIAVCLKYYPIVFVPFLFFNSNKRNVKFLVVFTVICFIVFGITYLKWGTSFVDILLYASKRESKVFSIFRYFRGRDFFLKPITGEINLDRYSTPVLALTGLLFFVAFIIKKNKNILIDSISAFAIVLMFYKVGHLQFHLVFILLYVYAMINSMFTMRVNIVFMVYVSWLSWGYTAFWFLNSFKGPYSKYRDWVGLPTFLVLLLLFYLLNFSKNSDVKIKHTA